LPLWKIGLTITHEKSSAVFRRTPSKNRFRSLDFTLSLGAINVSRFNCCKKYEKHFTNVKKYVRIYCIIIVGVNYMKFNWFGRLGIRLIIAAIALIVVFFGAAFETLSTAGRYTDFWDLPSAELKNNGHYGGAIWYVYDAYAEYGTVSEYTDEMIKTDFTYYIAEIYIEAIDESRLISISLRDPADIAMAEKNMMASYEEIDADPESYILWVDGLAEPLSAELQGYMYSTLLDYGLIENQADFDAYVIPMNVRQLNEEANTIFLIIGGVALVGIGVVIMVAVKKSKQKKAAASDGTVYMELPPEIAAAVKENETKTDYTAKTDGFTNVPKDAAMDEIGELPDMSNIPQPDNDSFFADLDRKKPKTETTPTSESKPSPFADVNENAEMGELVLPQTGENSVSDTSAEDYFNKDFISQ
jgi:hypothetical protein